MGVAGAVRDRSLITKSETIPFVPLHHHRILLHLVEVVEVHEEDPRGNGQVRTGEAAVAAIAATRTL